MATNTQIMQLRNNAALRMQVEGGIIKYARAFIDAGVRKQSKDMALAKRMLDGPQWSDFVPWVCSEPAIVAVADSPASITDAMVDAAIAAHWKTVAGEEPTV